ncbi:MAG: Rne/Rng family ribonuclease [Planctomycetota bacterium]
MSRRMLINALESEEVRIAVLDDGILQEYYVERESKETLVGNIYKGKVLNVHPGLQAAFVDIGIDKNAFLHASEIPGPITYDEQGREHRPMGEARQIANLAESGQEVLVQVIRDSVDAKGPSVSMDISLPGRYLVLTPRTPRVAVSKRISDPAEREGLKRLLMDLHPPEGLGYIIRTAGADRTGNDLQRDLEYLTRVWSAIARKAKTAGVPSAIYQESDLVIRTIRDMFGPEVAEITVDQAGVHNRVLEFFETLMPKYVGRVKFYDETEPLFHRYNVESQIEQIYERRVNLKSGGTIVIEPTEALVSIDVNSGKFTRETSPEEMAYRTNMEAAAEIARQLRLRDLGGQIVVDFIDMRDPRHRRNVEQILRNAIRRDRAQATILRTSRLGLVEMARQKIHAGIRLLSYEACGQCKGSGYVKTVESVALGLLRQIRFTLPRREVTGLKVFCNQDVAHYIVNVKRLDIEEVEKKADKAVTVLGDREMAVDRHEVLCVLHGGTEVPLEEMNFKPLPPPPEPPTPVEPTEELAEEPAGEEQGVLEERSPEPNEWSLPIEPREGEVEEPLPASSRQMEPDFEEDASRYEERAATAPGAEGGRDEWRARLTPRPHRRPEAGFHGRRQVRRPVEEPRQPMPRQEEPAQPVEGAPGPVRHDAGDEFRGGRGQERFGRDRDDRGPRGVEQDRAPAGFDQGRAPGGFDQGRAPGGFDQGRAPGGSDQGRAPGGFDQGRGGRGQEEGRGMRGDEGRGGFRRDEGRGQRGLGRGRDGWRRRDEARGGRGAEEGRGVRGPEEGRGVRGPEEGRAVRGPEEGRGMRGPEEGRAMRGPDEGRGFRGRGDAPRPGRPQGSQDDEWAVEEEFDAQEPPRRDEGRDRGDLAFEGGAQPPERQDRGFGDDRGPRRRRRGGRGRRRPMDGRGPGGYGDRDRAPREGGYAPYGNAGNVGDAPRQAPRDEDQNGWEPEGPPRGGREEGRGGFRRDEPRPGFRREEGQGGFRRDQGQGGFRRDEGRGGYRRDERPMEPRRDEGRGGYGRDEGRGEVRRDQAPVEPRRDDAPVEPRRDEPRGGFRRDEGQGGFRRDEGRGGFRRDEGRGGFRRDEGRGGFRRDEGQGGFPSEEGRGGFPREEERADQAPPVQGREDEPRMEPERPVQGREGAEPAADRGFGGEDRAPRGFEGGRGGRGGFRRGGREPLRRDERPPMQPREDRPPMEPREERPPMAPREEEAPRRDEVREAPPVEEVRHEEERPMRGRPAPELPRVEAPPMEPAAAPPAPEVAAPPAEEEEEIGVGFHRKTTGRRRGKKRTGKTRSGLGAALESDGGEGKAAPPAE